MTNTEAASFQPDDPYSHASDGTYTVPDGLLGKPALLLNEREEEYLELRRAFVDDLKPRGMLEYQLVEDVVTATWEMRRLKTLRNELISSAMVEAGAELLVERSRRLLSSSEGLAKADCDYWQTKLLKAMVKNQAAAELVKSRLKKLGLTPDTLYAVAFECKLNELRQIDQALDRVERSRHAALKEFQFVQASKAAHARRLSDAAIEDLPATVVETV